MMSKSQAHTPGERGEDLAGDLDETLDYEFEDTEAYREALLAVMAVFRVILDTLDAEGRKR